MAVVTAAIPLKKEVCIVPHVSIQNGRYIAAHVSLNITRVLRKKR
jgi:hypothetical protein